MKLISTTKIWDKGGHNAFTDLCSFNGKYYCCFRQGKKHMYDAGIIIILVSVDLISWQLSSKIREYNTDLRDPKLSVSPQNKLCLLYGSFALNLANKPHTLTTSWRTSGDGISWSSSHTVSTNFWLWQLSWFNNQALGLSYGANKVRLHKGHPNSTFEVINDNLFGLEKSGKGSPSESDIVYLPDNSAVCVLRRDADTSSAQLGRSSFPFTQWKWFDLHDYVGAPALIVHQNQVILAGRSWHKETGCKTSIWTINLKSNSLEKQLDLPSKGDTSYPGLIIKNNHLYVSYYSEHVNKKANIYLAILAL